MKRTYTKLLQLGMTPQTVRKYGKAEERRWGCFG
jgi:predicted transcriptional regulator